MSFSPTIGSIRTEQSTIGIIRGLSRLLRWRTGCPPEGAFSEQTLAMVQQMGYTTALWSFAYADWDPNNQMGYDKALERLVWLPTTCPSSIILWINSGSDFTNGSVTKKTALTCFSLSTSKICGVYV